jgi:hypothetical protein
MTLLSHQFNMLSKPIDFEFKTHLMQYKIKIFQPTFGPLFHQSEFLSEVVRVSSPLSPLKIKSLISPNFYPISMSHLIIALTTHYD